MLSEEFKTKYQNLLEKEDYQHFIESLSQAPIKSFRLNKMKDNYQDVSLNLNDKITFAPDSYYGNMNGNDVEQFAGYVYGQEPSAIYSSSLIQAQPGEKVLDLCAAPGGKSTTILTQLDHTGLLVSNDISSKRAKILLENIERFGGDNAVITNESPDRLSQFFGDYFDRIVVDAPCSGEGMFRKNPEAIDYWSNEYVLECQSRQFQILDEAYKMLKPNGTLVYSTCTYSPEENEQVVEYLIEKYTDFQVQEIPLVEGAKPGKPDWSKHDTQEVKKTARLWPHHFKGEGQFVAVLKRDGSKQPAPQLDNNKSKRHKKRKPKSYKAQLTQSEFELVAAFAGKNIKTKPDILNQVRKQKDHVVVPAIDPDKLKGIKVLRNGLVLGVLKKNRFEPHHSLALSLSHQDTNQIVELPSQDQFQRFLHGESLMLDNDNLNGFVLVSHNQKIFSWGKQTQKTLKNHFPKGLRK